MKTLTEIQDAISRLSENEQGELGRWLEIQLGTREMVEQVMRLTQSYAIWWEIRSSKNVKRYDDVLREYLDFFEPVTHILLWQGFFVICYQLFDQRSDSKHIQFRIDQVAQKDTHLADKIQKKIKNFAVLAKIKTIRHKISAHRGRNQTPQQVANDVGLVVKELREVVFFVQDIVSTLVEALDGEKKSTVMQKFLACQGSTSDNAFQVLQALAKSLRDTSPGMGQNLSSAMTDAHALVEKLQRSKPRIVVVDDDPSVLGLIKTVIDEQATVVTFQNGDEAWQEILREEPDILITDLRRPDSMDGWKMIQLLAEIKVEYPIVLLSALTKGYELNLKVLDGKDEVLRGKILTGELGDKDLYDETPSDEVQNLLRRVSPPLNIKFLAKPFECEGFLKFLAARMVK